MRTRSLFLVLVMTMISLIGVGPGPVCGQTPIKLKFSNPHPMTFSSAPVMAAFCDEIKKRTNGRVEITHYAGGTLTTFPKVYDGIVNQVSDIGHSHIGYTRGRFPVTEILDLPVGYSSGFVATHVKWDFFKKFKPKEWDEIHVLYFWSVGPQIFGTSKKMVKKFEDLKGLKIRGTGRPADTIKALGCVPVALEMGDVYDSMQRGLLDGMYDAMETWKGFRLGDVIKYGYLTQSATGSIYTFYVAMNKDKWNALPDDIKKIFEETSEEWVDKHAVTTLDADFAGMDYFKQKGGQIVKLPDSELNKMRKSVEPVIEDFIKDMEGKGYKRADMQAQVKFIRERIAYWTKQEKDRKLKSPYLQ
ncbi:MAG TPA: TRAP transporter substrate-binding protein [Syntrophorhabdaceae bacterium]|nr:TRAP transporter substrate-binding protein [Syntrophorhabdaceae bacterium]